MQDNINALFDVNMVISPEEVKEAIRKLADDKSCGLDTITAEHLKFASISGFLIHGILPDGPPAPTPSPPSPPHTHSGNGGTAFMFPKSPVKGVLFTQQSPARNTQKKIGPY